MNRTLRNAAVAALSLVTVFSASVAQAQLIDVDFPEGQVPLEIVVDAQEALPYIPFTVDDICKTSGPSGCIERYASDEIIRYVKTELINDIEREVLVFEGTLLQYVQYLNNVEQELVKHGYTLREDVQEFLFRRIPTDIRELRIALLEALGTYGPQVTDLIRDPLVGDQCPLLPVDKLNDLPDLIRDRAGKEVQQLQGLLQKLNDSQRVLCAMGYNAMELGDLVEFEQSVDDVNTDGVVDRLNALLDRIVRKRDAILAELGLSEYLKPFNLVSLDELKAYYDIANDIKALIDAKEFPGPERLESLRQKLNAQLPEDQQIPAVPNIPAVEAPVRQELDVKKRKDWSGFNFGDRRMVATEATAYTEVRGNEVTQTFTAYGKASAYLIENEVNLISGYGYAEAGPEKIAIKMEMKALGQDLFEPIDKSASVSIVEKNDAVFAHNFEEKASYNFTIGFIPMNVNVGARASIKLGYEVGIETTRIYGKVVPRADAAGFAEMAAGFSGLYAVGAGANLVLLDLNVPLSGEAGLKFDEVGYPYINLAIRADAIYEYLNGNVYAYAEYTVPRAGLPPWKLKKDTVELFRFRGQKVQHAILNWGLEVGRLGTVLKGDLIDRRDRQEAQDLDDAILAQQRREDLAKRQQAVYDRAARMFAGIRADLNSDYNLAALQKSEELKLYNDQFVDNLERFAEIARDANIR